jgi:DNA modification methylase
MRAKDRPLANDDLSDDEFEKMLSAWFGNIARVLEAGRAAYFWGGYKNLANYPSAFQKHKLYWSQCIIWNKMHPVMNRKDFLSCYELCFYCWKEGAAHQFFGQNNERDLWDVKKEPSQRTVHPTQKPVELAMRAIQLSSKPGENVLELFGGSGSTLIACEQSGRNCFAMEIDEAFCDVIVQRWQEFTGRQAERITASGEEADE